MSELLNVSYDCGYCGETNETSIDPTAGDSQAYTEDCTVCCRPNFLRIRILPDNEVSISVEYEG
jgi:hypothetical protein